MKLRKIVIMMLVLALTLCTLVVVASADEADREKCGDNLSWSLDGGGTLTISGTGDMYDYKHEGSSAEALDPPWYSQRNKVYHVVIGEGVTGIGSNAFAYCKNLKSVTVPASVTKIGNGAFAFDPGNWDGAYLNGWEYCYAVIFYGSRPQFSEEAFLDTASYEYDTEYAVTAGIYCFYPKTLWDEPSGCGVKWIAQDDMASGLNGPCGDEASWHLDRNGTLTISGTGPIAFESDDPLWNYVNLPVNRVVIASGITEIGWRTFAGSGLTDVAIADTVEIIDMLAFFDCENLTQITIPGSVVSIEDGAFAGCTRLERIFFQGNAPAIGSKDDSVEVGEPFADVKATVVYPADNSSWTAKVMKNYGGELTWVEYAPLEIITQPKISYTKQGKTAKTTVEANGTGITYQWYIKDTGDSEYTRSANQTDTYKMTMSAENKDRSVYCLIADVYGNTIETEPVCLHMAATITQQPVSTKAAIGEKATVKLTAAGDGLTYTWYQAAADSADYSKSSTFTGNSYSVEMTEARNGRKVYCVVEDQYGNSEKSDVVTLGIAQPPVIKTQPKTTYTKQDATAKVSVEAEGEGLEYQWYVKNAGDSKYSKSSVTSDTYRTTMRSAAKDRQIYCVITDQYGMSVKTKTVVLRMAATITAQPVNTSAPAGKNVSVTVKAVGDGLTYQWYYKNAGSDKFTLTKTFTGNAYRVQMSESRAGRQVYCVVKDQYGKTAKSDVVTLGMPVQITKQPSDGYAANGKTVTVTVKAEGDGLRYAWYVKNVGDSAYSKSSVTKATYSATMDSLRRNRSVYCVVTDQYGNSVKSKTVLLRMTASITEQPKNVMVAKGATAKITVEAIGDGLTYQWYIKNEGSSKFSKSSVTSATYSVKMTEKVDGRQVYCIVTDTYGKEAKSNAVTLSME